MLLTIDVGNTSTGLAVFDGDKIVAKNKLLTPDEINVIFLKSLIKKEYRSRITNIIVSSVVPFVDYSLKEAVKRLFGREALFIDYKNHSTLSYKIDNPAQLGADRIADCVGGLHFFEPPLVVIDSGTAITFDVISKDREYLGGVIFPGIELSIHSLAEKAAKLEKIHFRVPNSILGTNTEKSIRAGIFFNNVGGIAYIIKEYKKMLGEDAKVIATGGLSRYFENHIEGIDLYEPNLIYYGLRKIFYSQRP